ncbi:MAG: glycoside hydrolase family 172 protein [Bacteroidales bacterium]|nr:glycoside hydrolase family 172 protein [Bacteroidales bacterium]
MRTSLVLILASALFLNSCDNKDLTKGIVSTETLLDELVSLERLSYMPHNNYRTVQFSSYDRRSTVPGRPGWFMNSDGFGGEPEPGFQAVIREPDSTGIGEYLICDVRGPGAIVRTWTAMINGELDVYIDNQNEPLYSGDAQKFLWNTASALLGGRDSSFYESVFRQNDACYFPLPFRSGCRIIWKGNMEGLHFYHIQVRLYDEETEVQSFNKNDIDSTNEQIDKIAGIFSDPGKAMGGGEPGILNQIFVPAGGRIVVDTIQGPGQVTELAFSATEGDLNEILRKNVLNIFFDHASVAQVNAPLGDFFGAAPGINPYTSLPFSVEANGKMTCRFPMPFKDNACIIIENHSDHEVKLEYSIRINDYEWIDERSMHFRAKWRIDHDMTASNKDIQDIPYLVAKGKGRFVGVAAFIKNPSAVPSSWGNWWGEGDEKIFIDDDTCPSIFGTGSEDYFNYSWSSSALFDHMFCGQPRNDGPANRGFVTNYRFQIIDDVVFNSSFAFFMELFHHGVVTDFDYGRICYYYAPSETIDENMRISDSDLRTQIMPYWEGPVKYLGSAGYEFVEAEKVASLYPADRLFPSHLWSKGRAYFNELRTVGDSFKLRFTIDEKREGNIQLTMAHTPESGKVKIFIEGMEEETAVTIDLHSSYGVYSRNHGIMKTVLEPGSYSIIIETLEDDHNRIGVDFIWLPS